MDKIKIRIENVDSFNLTERNRKNLRKINSDLIENDSKIVAIIGTSFQANKPATRALNEIFSDYHVHRMDCTRTLFHGLLLLLKKRI